MNEDVRCVLEANRKWAASMIEKDPTFFESLSQKQNPKFLWIGCSDSRVPANQILDLPPGEVFVHRNIANVIVPSDLNSLSVIQFAIDVLHVEHIFVVGHYGCSGVLAALKGERIGLADNWLQHIKNVYEKHKSHLRDSISKHYDRLCELNAIEQVVNVSKTTVLQDAWARGQEISVHAFAYSICDGILENLHMEVSHPNEIKNEYKQAIASIYKKV